MQKKEHLADQSTPATDIVSAHVSWHLTTEALAAVVAQLALCAAEFEHFLNEAQHHFHDEIVL